MDPIQIAIIAAVALLLVVALTVVVTRSRGRAELPPAEASPYPGDLGAESSTATATLERPAEAPAPTLERPEASTSRWTRLRARLARSGALDVREVAMAHPVVIKDRNDMKINVFFRGFGETSLNFELRCFVREVETKSSVTSDLNLSIDKVFRQYGVDVPLPQRTVHVVPGEPETAPTVAKPTETPVKP